MPRMPQVVPRLLRLAQDVGAGSVTVMKGTVVMMDLEGEAVDQTAAALTVAADVRPVTCHQVEVLPEVLLAVLADLGPTEVMAQATALQDQVPAEAAVPATTMVGGEVLAADLAAEVVQAVEAGMGKVRKIVVG